MAKKKKKGIPESRVIKDIESQHWLSNREKLFKKQRTELGWDDRETWNLDQRIALFTLPRLKRFQKIRNGYPASMSDKEWGKIIDKMVYSMEILAGDKIWEKETDNVKLQEGFELFGKHFLNLWW
jgi:hypothetical protein